MNFGRLGPWYRRIAVCACAVAIILSLPGAHPASGKPAGVPASRAQPEGWTPKFVYAHMMHCFIYGETPVHLGSEDWANWTQHEFDDPSWWPESMAPASNAGVSSVRVDLAMGQAAGLDAFAVFTGDNKPFWKIFGPGLYDLASVAEGTPVKIMPDLWPHPAMTPADVAVYGQEVKAWIDSHPGAFATRNGKWMLSLGGVLNNKAISPAAFNSFYDAWGSDGRSKFYVIAEPLAAQQAEAAAWAPYVDAITSWRVSSSWSGGIQADWLPRATASYGRDLSWPVIIAFSPTHADQAVRAYAEDLGMSLYIDLWRKAMTNGSQLVQIETWNDFGEDSAITDTNVRGRSIIDLTAYFSEWAHTGRVPEITQERVFLFHRRQLVDTQYTDATKVGNTPSWASHTPSTDWINVVTMLKTPATITATDGTTRWSTNVPAGLHEWLLYVPSTVVGPTTATGAAYLHYDSYPVTSPTRTVTRIRKLTPGVPGVEVVRDGKTLVQGMSRTGWQATAKWQDMSVIGDEWVLPN
jgi:hypothetical protein